MITNFIDYIGIDENLPTNIKYFKEDLLDTVFSKKDETKEIHTIISTSVDCNVNSIKLVNTSSRTSNEGQKLSGKKLLVEVKLSYRIKYTTNTKETSLYILKTSHTKVIYIVVPREINGFKIEDLVRKNKVSVETFIEDLYVSSRGPNSIYIRTLLLVNARLKNTM
ncbi:hypothetical protein [Romboutsia sp.]|uniref:hypothetical protein n=1 Tax=Romboutsia sp. TaxID=1965302 RepID=UPI003F39FC61